MSKSSLTPLDTTDVDRWIGIPLGGGQLKESVHINDIRRWAQGMQNPNPICFDEKYAADSVHGELIAPQSFTICTDVGHGATPAIQGNIPGQHMLFGGDEWWFFGPRIRPGDTIRQERMLYDYRVTDTKFAGPTMFSRGDTTYIQQTGEVVAKQRSTSIRYLVENARELNLFGDDEEKEWSDEELEKIEQEKADYYHSYLDLGHDKRLFVKVGDKLPRRPIGPHTLLTFATEWRSYTMTVWGSSYEHGVSSTQDSGWTPEMSRDPEGAKIDPANADGLYKGASRGHAQPRWARHIGMPRGYGYGATMGAWVLDYLTNWSGEHGFVVHSDVKYRFPALTGDLTYLDGEVTNITHGETPIAHVRVTMTTHEGAVMAAGDAEVALPAE
ncbi:MaoC family dehydratase N-terminal domain-containing protein [Myxococcota bacterium]|nr:MaoC family dehydratase N-terminal domain-containing protein [Myxococcota bacterium]